jgi:hypothetical protein
MDGRRSLRVGRHVLPVSPKGLRMRAFLDHVMIFRILAQRVVYSRLPPFTGRTKRVQYVAIVSNAGRHFGHGRRRPAHPRAPWCHVADLLAGSGLFGSSAMPRLIAAFSSSPG